MQDVPQTFLDPRSRERIILAFAGLLQGIAAWVVLRIDPREPWEQALWFGALVWILSAGLLFQFSSCGNNHIRLGGLTLALALPFALMTYHVVGQVPPKETRYGGDGFRLGTWTAAGTLGLYILVPYLQLYHKNRRWDFPYSDLYQHSWNNFFLASLGWFYTGVYWTLVWICAGLFQAIGITAIKTLVSKPAFIALTTGLIGGLGIALAKEHTQIITTLRTIAGTLFRSLTALLVSIVLSFLVTLPFTGPTPLWNTKYASAILLALLLLILLFVNAVLQDGEGARPYGNLVRRGVEATLLSMPILVGLTLYSMGLRIEQHGLTPERYYAIVFAVALGGYSLGYAWSVLRPEPLSFRVIRRCNVGLSFVVFGLAMLLHTPLMDPLKRSAEDQERRFLNGTVDVAHFDFGAMRFDLGHYGQAVLDRMNQLTAHPAHQEITTQLSKLQIAKHKWEWDKNTALLTADEFSGRLSVFPQGHTVPYDLLSAMTTGDNRFLTANCSAAHRCDLIAGQWDADADTEYVFITTCQDAQTGCTHFTVALYDRAQTTWKQIASVPLSEQLNKVPESRDVTLAAAKEGHLQFSGAQYHCLTAGDGSQRVCDYWGNEHR